MNTVEKKRVIVDTYFIYHENKQPEQQIIYEEPTQPEQQSGQFILL